MRLAQTYTLSIRYGARNHELSKKIHELVLNLTSQSYHGRVFHNSDFGDGNLFKTLAMNPP